LVSGWYLDWLARKPSTGGRARALAQRLPPGSRRRAKALHTHLTALPGRLGSLVPEAGARGIPVLMYHRVAPSGSSRTARWRVSPSQFDEHLDALGKAGYEGVSLDQLRQAWYEGARLPRRPVVLTFDDGYADFAEHAWPKLSARGLGATVFAVSDAVGATNGWDDVYEDPVALMDWTTLTDLAQQGLDLGSHSADHPTLTSLSPAAVLEQLARSRQRIEDETGAAVQTFAYPYGDTDDAVADLVGLAGYALAVTCEPGPVTGNANPLLLPRVEVMGTTSPRALVGQLARLRAKAPAS
jgi:peptidoglycan/xylan/chitin deacetylase (PgdA/CDA1 family)